MGKKIERDMKHERLLYSLKAAVGAVLEQSSTPELAVLVRFFENHRASAQEKYLVLLGAVYDIRAARKSEDAATRKAARKLNRRAKDDEEPVAPQDPVPFVEQAP